jgi:peptidoglycan/xylan/chitin deacetylase (PgdA/CDA1 family)
MIMARGKKALAGECLGNSGGAGLLLRLRPYPAEQLLILAYHRVLDVGDEAQFMSDPELVSASPADFAWQMRFVRQHFQPISFARLTQTLDQGLPLPRKSIIITFDDGHIDNYTVAFPILRELGMPATIFVSTDYISNGQAFWFEQVAADICRAPAGRYRLATLDLAFECGDMASRREASYQVLAHLKRAPDALRLRALHELASLMPAGVGEPGERKAFNWDEARHMAAHGIEFGSHTMSHAILARLDDAQLAAELTGSARVMERELGHRPQTVAYPAGKSGDYDARVAAAAQHSGYRLGIAYDVGINQLGALDTMALKRLAVERYTSRAMFKSMLALPQVFG